MIINWAITKGCNLTCFHCCNATQRRTWARDLTTDEAKTVIEKLAEGGVMHVLLIGGEVTIRPDALELIEYIKSRGMQPWLTTNAQRLTDEHIERLARVDATITISIDGATAQTNDAIRGPGTFAKATSALTKLAQARKRYNAREPLQVNFSLMRTNLPEAVDGLRLVTQLGATAVTYTELLPFESANHRSATEELTIFEKLSVCYELAKGAKELGIVLILPLPMLVLDRFKEQLGDVDLRTALEYRCTAGLHTCMVTNDGYLLPCGYQMAGIKPSSVSLLRNSFRDVYFSDVFTRFIQKANDPRHLEKLPQICKDCDYRKRKMCQPGCFMGLLDFKSPARACEEIDAFLQNQESFVNASCQP